MTVGSEAPDRVALTVHGPAGAVDLLVPLGASAADVALEYAAQAGLPGTPALGTSAGRRLDPDAPLAAAGVRSGSLLVVLDLGGPDGPDGPGGPGGAVGPSGPGRRRRTRPEVAATAPGPGAGAWTGVAAGLAGLAGWSAAQVDGALHQASVVVLVVAAVLGVVPVGRLAAYRVLAAPAFAAAAAFAVVWQPDLVLRPTVVGVTALVAALAAAVGRALGRAQEEALRVWVVVGTAVFVVTVAGALVGAPTQLVWGVLLVLAVLAPRFVPGLAVDVPDQLLLDLERLAVTAWSARERPAGRRGRTIVPQAAVAAVATSGARTITAACAGVLLVVAVAAPSLLSAADVTVDVIGARVMVLTSGAAILLAARSYRHRPARALLRLAGLVCWAALGASMAPALREGAGLALAVAAVVVAALVVPVAVATGRGWRSAWWARRAEVAEGLSSALALASLVVASGFFRSLWESIPDV
ncbi:hypothetical protein I601_1519 [Nocardioides dokdonensis FR1436]|uniref:EccD-like transmembrane domain-containing protein n=1 Tax=Nocardioides dokdonensis FR1436 TaxID=1300347 RepID=A0A1A9GI88_9ACTN|nr:EsaB/YukD family protein [Nocardioides dokdonensis]ANH37954.1 hypothetical protein I601_1519 [Nocardioides dokdonensis FR1436]